MICRLLILAVTLWAVWGLGSPSDVCLADVIDGPFVNPANNHTYLLLAQDNWSGSEAEAVTLGGHLVTINDADENQWVFDTFSQDRNLWIGLYQPAGSPEPDGGWTWISGEPVEYLNWDVPEPNDSGYAGEDYVQIWGNAAEIAGDPDFRHAGKWCDVSNDGYLSLPFGVVEVVPEPSTITLWLLAGIASIGWIWRKRRR